MIDQRIILTGEGMAHLLQSPGIVDESPVIRQELAGLLRQTADMIETQEFNLESVRTNDDGNGGGSEMTFDPANLKPERQLPWLCKEAEEGARMADSNCICAIGTEFSWKSTRLVTTANTSGQRRKRDDINRGRGSAQGAGGGSRARMVQR